MSPSDPHRAQVESIALPVVALVIVLAAGFLSGMPLA